MAEEDNALPDPAAFAASTGPKKKKKFNAGGMEASHVNINSLLDVLSVILVFLMKSYSANSVQIKPGPDLQVPMSPSTAEVQESTTVTVTLKNLMVDDVPILTFEGGKVPEKERSGGGFMIDALFQKLQEEVDHQKKIEERNHDPKAAFKGIVTIIGDRNVPFDLIAQAMYTAGQAQFSKFKFAAIKVERE